MKVRLCSRNFTDLEQHNAIQAMVCLPANHMEDFPKFASMLRFTHPWALLDAQWAEEGRPYRTRSLGYSTLFSAIYALCMCTVYVFLSYVDARHVYVHCSFSFSQLFERVANMFVDLFLLSRKLSGEEGRSEPITNAKDEEPRFFETVRIDVLVTEEV